VNSFGRLRIPTFALVAAFALAFRPTMVDVAAAYNGVAAASWADAHGATGTYNCTQLHCQTDDCVNFVSWAMYLGGGYPQHLGDGFESNYHNWFETIDGLGNWVPSDSWVKVNPQMQFQLLHIPGGYYAGQARGTATNSFTGLSQGDLLAYDWDSNGTYTHIAIQTSEGKDLHWSSSQVGDRVDQHTTDRVKAWWTLYPYNSQRNTTNIQFIHIYPSN
jgi:putative amidase-like protein